MSGATTRVGINRERYAATMGASDPRPSRFTGTSVHADWCERADNWANGVTGQLGADSLLSSGDFQGRDVARARFTVELTATGSKVSA